MSEIESGPWYVDDNKLGEGPRPDFLRPKYKSLTEQAKAYTELEKRFGEAPEHYDLGAYSEHVDVNNRHLQEFMGHAKEHRLTQDAFQKMIGSFVDYDKSMQIDVNKEIEKLGPDGRKKVQVVDQWAKNTLSPAQYESMNGLPQTAEMVNILDELRQRMLSASSRTPQDNGGDSFKPVTEAEVRAKIRANPDKYLKDSNYRAQISKELELAVGKS
jgi:hypothetical protein